MRADADELRARRRRATCRPARPLPATAAERQRLPRRAADRARRSTRGADIVITGRCVDSAVTLGALMHEFGWPATTTTGSRMGSLAGHIIECGCQATGGLFTDWRGGAGLGRTSAIRSSSVARRRQLHRHQAARAPAGSCRAPVVAEQMLYEIGDPGAYLLPDVVCDFTRVTMSRPARTACAVDGARGRAPTDTYKVSATYADGFRCDRAADDRRLRRRREGASAPARRSSSARADCSRQAGLADYTDTCIEVLGAESGYGPHAAAAHAARGGDAARGRRIADKRALEMFAREIAPAGTSWAPGTTGAGGRPQRRRACIKQFAFLLAKARGRRRAS